MLINFSTRKREEFSSLLNASITVDNKLSLNDFSEDEYYSLCVNYLITCHTPLQQYEVISSASKRISNDGDMNTFNACLIYMASRGVDFDDIEHIANPSCPDDYWFNKNVGYVKSLITESVKENVDAAFLDEIFEIESEDHKHQYIANDRFYNSVLAATNLKRCNGFNFKEMVRDIHLRSNQL